MSEKDFEPAYKGSYLYKVYRQSDDARMFEMTEDEVNAEMQKVGVDLLCLSSQFNILLGKLLTFVDASFDDPQRRKAFKDIIRGMVNDSQDELFMLSDGKKISK